MNFLITESQLKYLLENQDKDSLTNELKKFNSFSKDILKSVSRRFGFDTKLLLIWGTSIGAFTAPLDNFIRTGNFDVTEEQISLLLFGCVATLLLDNEKYVKDIYDVIKEEGLLKTFNKVRNKGKELKDYFIGFLNSLNISITNVVSLVRYMFLIPIIPDLLSYFNNVEDLETTSLLIAKRIIASGVVTVSSEVLFQIIKRSLRRVAK